MKHDLTEEISLDTYLTLQFMKALDLDMTLQYRGDEQFTLDTILSLTSVMPRSLLLDSIFIKGMTESFLIDMALKGVDTQEIDLNMILSLHGLTSKIGR